MLKNENYREKNIVCFDLQFKYNEKILLEAWPISTKIEYNESKTKKPIRNFEKKE